MTIDGRPSIESEMYSLTAASGYREEGRGWTRLEVM